MQPQPSSFWTTPILAFCLSLLFSMSLAPALGVQGYQQYDFCLLWLMTMLLLALPFTILEIALAKRAKSAPLQAFMQLTRDADRSTRWRLVSWLAVVLIPFVAGGMLNFSAQQLVQQGQLTFAPSLMMLLLLVVACALSLLPRIALLILAFVASIAVLILAMLVHGSAHWQWTPIVFSEWFKVVVLSLVTGGLGLGLYWQNALHVVKTQQTTWSVIFPIWLAQVFGLGAFLLINGLPSNASAVAIVAAAVTLVAILLQYVREQLLERQISIVVQAVVLLVPVLVWAIPQTSRMFYDVLVTLGLLLCLAYAIFTGWLMKISHLRKALNFSNEASYNLWRILIRIVAPVSIVLALLGWVLHWVGY